MKRKLTLLFQKDRQFIQISDNQRSCHFPQNLSNPFWKLPGGAVGSRKGSRSGIFISFYKAPRKLRCKVGISFP